MRRARIYRKNITFLLDVSCKQMTSSVLCFLRLQPCATQPPRCLYLSLCVLFLPLLAVTCTCKTICPSQITNIANGCYSVRENNIFFSNWCQQIFKKCKRGLIKSSKTIHESLLVRKCASLFISS